MQDQPPGVLGWQVLLTICGLTLGIGTGWATYVLLDKLTSLAGLIGFITGVGFASLLLAAVAIVGVLGQIRDQQRT
jgi:hypothetical protein